VVKNKLAKTLNEEYKAKTLNREGSPKVTGFVFLLLAFIVLMIGLMVHYIQTGGLSGEQTITVMVQQLNIKFAIDFTTGFFVATFLIIGIIYLRQIPIIKPITNAETTAEEESEELKPIEEASEETPKEKTETADETGG
jgi:hypothetical protein